MLDRLPGAAISSPSAQSLSLHVWVTNAVYTIMSSGVACSTVLLHAACLLASTLPAPSMLSAWPSMCLVSPVSFVVWQLLSSLCHTGLEHCLTEAAAVDGIQADILLGKAGGVQAWGVPQ